MFLTPELKTYYQEDFKKVLNYSGNPYWSLDPGIEPYLVSINGMPGLQSLYSRFHGGHGLEDPVSYIRLAYLENWKSAIQRVCINLIRELDGREAEVIVQEEEPQPNRVFESKSAAIGCLNNPDYFGVAQYYIALRSEDLAYHRKFWEKLVIGLSAIELS